MTLPATYSLEFPIIVPYCRTTQRQKWVDPRYKRYAAWKRDLRIIADARGWPTRLNPDWLYKFGIVVSWTKRAHADLDNVVNWFLDALFKQDRRILRIDAEAVENTGRENLSMSLVRY